MIKSTKEMKAARKKTIVLLAMGLVFVTLIVLAFLVFPEGNTLTHNRKISNLFYLSLTFLITLAFAYARFCVSDRKIRWFLFLFYALEIFWIIAKTLTFNIPHLYVWYSYYIPMLGLPYVLLTMVIYMMVRDKKTRVWIDSLLGTLSLFYLACVFTSNYHSLVFVGHMGGGDYSYGPIYFALAGTIFVELAVSLTLFFLVTRKKSNGLQKAILLIVMAFGLSYSVAYAILPHLPPYLDDMTLIYIIISSTGLHICVRYGLFIDTGHYDFFYESLSIPMSIVTRGGDHYDNALMLNPPEGAVYKDKETVIDSNRFLRREDVTNLTTLNETKKRQLESLKTTNAILLQKKRLQEEKENDEARQSLYAGLETQIEPEYRKLEDLVEQLPDELDGTLSSRKELGAIKDLCGYLKKKSFLFLLGEKQDSLSREEISLFYHESFFDLKPALQEGELIVNGFTTMPLPLFASFYASFHEIVSLLKGDYSLLLTVYKKERYGLRLSIIDSPSADIPTKSLDTHGLSISKETSPSLISLVLEERHG